MNTYYLRTTDYPTLLELGAALGAISLRYAQYDEEGVGIGAAIPAATDGGCFDYIGTIPAGDGVISDENGDPYIHVNLVTPHDIRRLAERSTIPQVQAALGTIAAFFVTDEHGAARRPAAPFRVFAGDE